MISPLPGWLTAYYDSDDYVLSHQKSGAFEDTPNEVAFIIRRTVPRGRVLDVGCGFGRHLLEFARRGFQGVGVDVSKRQLKRAEAEAERLGLGPAVRFLCQDARELDVLGPAFDLAVSLFSSFGSMPHADNVLMLQRMTRHLRPGGFLVLDVDSVWAYRRTFKATGGTRAEGDFSETLALDTFSNIVHWSETHGNRSYCGEYRLYDRNELRHMIRDGQHARIRFFGSFRGDPYFADSPRLIAVAQLI